MGLHRHTLDDALGFRLNRRYIMYSLVP